MASFGFKIIEPLSLKKKIESELREHLGIGED